MNRTKLLKRLNIILKKNTKLLTFAETHNLGNAVKTNMIVGGYKISQFILMSVIKAVHANDVTLNDKNLIQKFLQNEKHFAKDYHHEVKLAK